jgi:hypothetical protein
MLDDNDLRDALIRFREDEIFQLWPDDPASRKYCILRRAMIDHLIRFKPRTVEDWIDALPCNLLRGTEPRQVEQYRARIIEIVRRHCERAAAYNVSNLSARTRRA